MRARAAGANRRAACASVCSAYAAVSGRIDGGMRHMVAIKFGLLPAQRAADQPHGPVELGHHPIT
jgi:hypothetical protein